MKLKLPARNVLIVSFLIYFSTGKCEQMPARSFQYYDSITYQQYLAGSWNDLIWNGKEALVAGYDNKYLRLRMGFAYFYKANYRFAANHFSEALKFDSYDTTASFYFNLSCVAAGRANEVYHVKGTRKPYRTLDFIYADAGAVLAGDANESAALTDSVIVYKELIQPVSRTFASVGLHLRPLPNLSFFVGFSQIALTDKKSFGYQSQDAVRNSIRDTTYGKVYTYSFPIVNHQAEQEFSNKQTSFYMNLAYFPLPGLKITPAFHLLHIQAARVFASPVTEARSDTAWYNKSDNTWHTFDYTSYNYDITNSDTSYFDQVFSLAVSKEIGKFNFEVSGSYSRILEKKIYQFGTALSWYPFGNMNLYAHGSFAYQNDQSQPATVVELMAGGKLYKNGWVESFYSFGELKNHNEKNSYLVYNQVYPITMRCGITYYQYIGRHLELMLMYRFQKMGLFLTTATLADVESVVTNPDYSYSTLSTGVKWKF